MIEKDFLEDRKTFCGKLHHFLAKNKADWSRSGLSIIVGDLK
jgi:hypothetical protein